MLVQIYYACTACELALAVILTVSDDTGRAGAREYDFERWTRTTTASSRAPSGAGSDRAFSEPGLERRRAAFRPGGRDRRAAERELRRGRSHAEPVRALRQLDSGRLQQPRSQPRSQNHSERVAFRRRDVPPRRPQSRRRARSDRISRRRSGRRPRRQLRRSRLEQQRPRRAVRMVRAARRCSRVSIAIATACSAGSKSSAA